MRQTNEARRASCLQRWEGALRGRDEGTEAMGDAEKEDVVGSLTGRQQVEKPGWGSGGNCSNCAMAWGERATNLDPAYTDVNRGMDPGLMARFCPHSVAKQQQLEQDPVRTRQTSEERLHGRLGPSDLSTQCRVVNAPECTAPRHGRTHQSPPHHRAGRWKI